jgi:hypothetical protein
MGGQVGGGGGGGGGSNSADECRATLSLRPNSSESKKSLSFVQSINFLWVVVVVEKGNPNWMDGVDKLQLKTWPMGQFFSLLQTYFHSFLALWAFVHVILGNPETLYIT